MQLVHLFRTAKPVIGMLHAPALPGAPARTLDFREIQDWVFRDAEALSEGGADGLILENFGDAPFYPRRVPAHTVAAMTVLALGVKARFGLPLGINVLRNDGLSALAIAAAAGAQFVRVNVYTGARLTDQGIIEGEAFRLLRYRRMLGCEAALFADVAVKHSAALAARPLEEEIEDTAVRGRADAIIVSGAATGKHTSLDDVKLAKAAAGEIPVLVGSGATANDAGDLLSIADGLIVGTGLKEGGVTANRIDPVRVGEFIQRVRASR